MFLCVLSFILSRLLEKPLNDEITIATTSEKLSELKAISVNVSGGKIISRSES